MTSSKFSIWMGGLLLSSMIFFSCRHEFMYPENTPIIGGDQTCSTDTVYFQNQVLPLIISNCAKPGCHDAGTRQKDVQLTSYSTIMNTADVRPGNPNGSDLYRFINESDPRDVMPPAPNSPLTAAQKQLIYTWIEQGARNNACNDCDTTLYTYSGTIQPLVQSYCTGCHNATTNSAGLNLTSYDAVRGIALNGKFMGTITHSAGFPAMPRGAAKMSDCRITQVQNWIDDGSPNN